MKNIITDYRNTYFIDLDGTLVMHNYDPENIQDVFLPGSIEYLNSIKKEYLILTTARRYEHIREIIKILKENHGISFTQIICNLPIGIRYLINDYKDNTHKAFAINIERNKGFDIG